MSGFQLVLSRASCCVAVVVIMPSKMVVPRAIEEPSEDLGKRFATAASSATSSFSKKGKEKISKVQVMKQ